MNAGIQDTIDRSIAALKEAGVPFEELAEYEPARRRCFGSSRARFRPLGQVWRLGVLLLSPAGTLYSVGTSTRAVPPRHPNNQSLSAEARRHFRDVAFRGPFTEGATVNFDARVVRWTPDGLQDPKSAVFEAGGQILVRWRTGADASNSICFADYVEEKVGFASHRDRQ